MERKTVVMKDSEEDRNHGGIYTRGGVDPLKYERNGNTKTGLNGSPSLNSLISFKTFLSFFVFDCDVF